MKTEYLEFGDCKITLLEAKIIALLCMGKDRYNISLEPGNKPSTLDKEISRIFLKTRKGKVTELVVHALKNGFDDKGNFKNKPLFE